MEHNDCYSNGEGRYGKEWCEDNKKPISEISHILNKQAGKRISRITSCPYGKLIIVIIMMIIIGTAPENWYKEGTKKDCKI